MPKNAEFGSLLRGALLAGAVGVAAVAAAAETDVTARDTKAEAAAEAASAAAAAPATDPAPQAWEETEALLLELGGLQVDLEVTSATKTAVRAAEAPSMVTVIPRSTLVAMGYRTVAEALASVPGLYVVDDLVTANVAIRGIHGGPDSWSRVMKVMVDGQPVTFHTTGGTLMGPELIPIEAVEAIEVIRGPGSALYGGGAFLGVVNVITRTPPEGATVRVGLEGGLVRGNPGGGAEVFGAVRSGGEREGAILFAASGGRLDRSGLAVPEASPLADRWSGTTSRDDLARPVSLFAKGSWDGRGLGTLGLTVLHQRLDSVAEFSDVGILSHGTRIALSNTIVRLDHLRGFFDERLSLHSRAGLTLGETLPIERLDAGDPGFFLKRERSSLAADAATELTWTFGIGSLLVGADALHMVDEGDAVYQVTRTADGRTGDVILRERVDGLTVLNVGAYSQLVLRPLPGIGVTGGVRYDYNNLWDDAVNVRVAAVWSPRNDLHVKALYGTSYLPPAPTQLNALPLRLRGVRGNPDLESQRASTVEAGVTWQPMKFLSTSANAFWTAISDRIEFVDVGSNLTARNLTESGTLGAEATLELRRAPFFALGNVSFQHTEVTDPSPTPSWWDVVYDPDGPGGRLPPGYPGWTANLGAGVLLAEQHLQASIAARFTGERKASQTNIRTLGQAYVLAPFFVLDATVSSFDLQLVDGRSTSISLHVENLLDTRYAEPGVLGADVPSRGRTLFLRLAQEL